MSRIPDAPSGLLAGARAFTPLTLPNGAVIPNRIAKASMEENMAQRQAPSERLIRLYRAWAEGGAGLILTGNVMVDARAMTGPGGVVLEDERDLAVFRRWAEAARAGGAQAWMQLNHPGRQMRANLGQVTWAPSAVPLSLGASSRFFAAPRPLEEAQIHALVARFARSALLAEQAGFTGVQIHAAHGYLLSQFLSPLTNRREDRWGGTLANRARFLLEVVRAVRAAVAPGFCVAVKINSADFQRGGFGADEAATVVRWLNEEAVDLVELSGGSYEAPAMQGDARDGRTLAREAYFLEFAQEIRQVARMPLMVTGGIRRLAVVEDVLRHGIDMAGLATALAIAPDLPRRWQRGEPLQPQLAPVTWKAKTLAAQAVMGKVKLQLRRLGRGQPPRPQASSLYAFVSDQVLNLLQARRYRRLMARRQGRGEPA